jgi:hypothetical protein
MSQIPGKIHTFKACDSDTGQSHVISKKLPVPEKIELKVGAQVRNSTMGWVRRLTGCYDNPLHLF